ncbi:hypothetical protein V498_08407, partial [Pseudogymnoascus sp. VKM F-4517 (FW-2822)]
KGAYDDIRKELGIHFTPYDMALQLMIEEEKEGYFEYL